MIRVLWRLLMVFTCSLFFLPVLLSSFIESVCLSRVHYEANPHDTLTQKQSTHSFFSTKSSTAKRKYGGYSTIEPSSKPYVSVPS